MKKILVFLLTFLVMIAVLIVSNRTETEPGEKQQPFFPPQVRPFQPVPPVFGISEALSVITKEELKSIMTFLTSAELEGRLSGKKGNDKARDYIKKFYQDQGLDVQLQEFVVEDVNSFKEQGTGKTSNVIADMGGKDLPSETVIIGAHYDHVGYGPNMSRSPSRREIHPGADDNASGTVALLGAAKALSKLKGKTNRRIVFIAFSGEEMGLIGSKYYVSNPRFGNTVFMLNMDMVGRLNGKTEIDALGAANSQDIKNLLENLKGYPFRPHMTTGSGGGSDHVPFYNKNIPVAFLHTGMHDDYHTPDDTASKIDYDGLTWVAKYAANIIWEVDRLTKKPMCKETVRAE